MAGRLDIVITGLQDTHLTGNPQLSHFLTRFKRHTQFAFEVNECQFDGLVEYGETLNCKIPQFRADFIKNMTIKLARSPLAPVGTSWSPSFMSHLIEFAELYIGGRLIEKITGEYIYLYQQLRNNDFDTRQTLYFLTGHGDLLDTYDGEYVYFLDLPFYFYRNPGLSIPLCALSKQNVEVKIKLRKFNEVILDPSSYGGKINRISLNVENVYVTPEEKSFFMSNEINQMITQLQLSRFKMKPNELKKDVLLNFQNPVREMYFVSQSNVSVNSNFSNQYNKIKSVELKINNETLFHKKGKEVGYDHTLEKYINAPIASDFGGPIEIEQRKFGPNVFGNHSFALNPMKPEPSGHINMSRIAHKVLSIEIEPLTGINENTLTTQVDNEFSSIPFTLTTDTQTPFTETITTDTTTITITPVTITNNLITKKERVSTTATTVTTVTSQIGLSLNPTQPTQPNDIVTTTVVINTLNDPVSTVFVSTVDGTPAVTVSAVSSTVTVFQDPVSAPTYQTLGQKNIDSTTSASSFETFIRTGTVNLKAPSTSTQIDFVDGPTDTPITTTPVRVVGDIDDLLQGSVDSTPVVNSTGTNDNGTTNVDDTQNVSQGTSLFTPGSSAIFSLANPFVSTSAQSGTGVTTALGTRTSNPGAGFTYSKVPNNFANTIKFDTETEMAEYGSICQLTKDSSRIITTKSNNLTSAAAYIYRHVLKINGVTNETFLNEYFTSNRNAGNTGLLHRNESSKQTVTNVDGSVMVSSNYDAINYSFAEVIDVSTLTRTSPFISVTGTDYFGSYSKSPWNGVNDAGAGAFARGLGGWLDNPVPFDTSTNPATSIGHNASIWPDPPSSYASRDQFYGIRTTGPNSTSGNGSYNWTYYIEDTNAPTNSGGSTNITYFTETRWVGVKFFTGHDDKLWKYNGSGSWTQLSYLQIIQ